MDIIKERDQLFKYFDMKIEEASKEYARVSMPFAQKVLNGMGVAHGGSIFSLIDIAFGAASNCAGKTVTLSANVHYLRPCTSGPVVAEAKLVKSGRYVCVYDVTVVDGSGKTVARSTVEGFNTEDRK